MNGMRKTVKSTILTIITACLFGCAGGGGTKYQTSTLLPFDARVGLVYNSERARKIDEIVCKRTSQLQQKAAEHLASQGKAHAFEKTECAAVEAGRELVMVDFLKNAAIAKGATNVAVVDETAIPEDLDYLVYLQMLQIGCKPASDSAGTIATGAIMQGVTAAFLPVSFGRSVIDSARVSYSVLDRKNKVVIGSGMSFRQGGRLVVNCDKMLMKVATEWVEKQFAITKD